MNKKRSKLEVINDLLQKIAEKGSCIRITPLARYSNLSPQSFNEYYFTLLSKGFIKEVTKQGVKNISLTEKGFQYIKEYGAVIKFVDTFEL